MDDNNFGEESTIIDVVVSEGAFKPHEEFPAKPPVHRWWSGLLENLSWAVLVFAFGRLGFAFADPSWRIPVISPQLGLAFAILWERGANRWVGVFVGILAATLMSFTPMLGVAMAVIEVLCLLVATRVLRRQTRERPLFQSLRDSARFLGNAIFLVALPVAVLDGLVISALDVRDVPLSSLMLVRWLSHTTGAVVVGLLFLAWWPRLDQPLKPRRLSEAVVLMLLFLVVGAWVFGRPIGHDLLPIPDVSLLLPMCLLTVVRFGVRGSVAAGAALAALCLLAALNESGPFLRAGGWLVSNSLLMAAVNSLIASITMLLSAVLLEGRQSSELMIQRMDARFRFLFENSPDAVFVVDGKSGRVLEFNDRLPELLGCSSNDLISGNRSDFEVQSLDGPVNQATVSLLHPRTQEQDTQYRRHNGQVIEVQVTYSSIDYFGQEALLLIARDVTARRRAESILRESEHKLRSLAESIPALVAIQTGSIPSYWNQAASEITGYSLEELKNMDFVSLLSPKFRAETIVQIRRCIRSKVITGGHREVSLRHKGGSERLLDLSLKVMMLNGRSACLITAVDVTERSQAEANIRNLNAQLFHAGRLRLLGEFVAGVAHDLRHPIGSIRISSDALTRRLNATDTVSVQEIKDQCGRIHSLAERALARLSQLQDLAKRHVTNRQWLDFASLFEDAKDLICMNDEWSQVPITFVSMSPRPFVFADRAEIIQVLLDLFRNGLESMQATPHVERRISVAMTRHETGFVRVSIHDVGCGIPSELRELFRKEGFQPFHTTKPQGLGMGLSLCQAVVNSHEGQMWLEPPGDSGTTFHFSLRCDEPRKAD